MRYAPRFYSKKGQKFRLMVTGSSCTGYQSCINALCEKHILDEQLEVDPEQAHLERPLEIKEHEADIQGEEFRVALTVIEACGFGDMLDRSSNFDVVTEYLENQLDQVLVEESKIRRNSKFVDKRVDALLYFIEPYGHCLSEFDLEAMRRFSRRVNVIPVIGVANAFTKEELNRFKQRIFQELVDENIQVFDFPFDDDEDEDEVIEENKRLKSILPFAVSGAAVGDYQQDSDKLAKHFPWGTFYVDDPSHSDFLDLKTVLFISHLQHLKFITQQFYYEAYRTERLSNASLSSNSLHMLVDHEKPKLGPDELSETTHHETTVESEIHQTVPDQTSHSQTSCQSAIKNAQSNSDTNSASPSLKSKQSLQMRDSIKSETSTRVKTPSIEMSLREFPQRNSSKNNKQVNEITETKELKSDDVAHGRFENVPYNKTK
ncbi:septin Spn7 [Schizosaccharomyces cryophilus OY26]|uniref:Septin Spn7 n=1 Tax=Schizosaccharomyces cryophilus (strain OY26 / ATCC MYA-4695 / CBS 11777 / NBRC 106824 / NRRL Y48691) TaxID=653667 RepID=S9X101_SCHCR|nr:septin Spn7 [Schizosaccharomyces cryophilus OY26]EPY50707.1 septin Spn7 [Schizosaccharomyces cryophilus OY26]